MGQSVFPPAASGPTLSEITTAGTSAGWGATKGADITWTQLSYTSPSATSVTFSSLSGYKYYRVVVRFASTSGDQGLRLRINSDSSSNNYNYYGTELLNTNALQYTFSFGTDGIYLGRTNNNNNFVDAIISNADQSNMLKNITADYQCYDSGWKSGTVKGNYHGSGAVTSITLRSESGGTYNPQGSPYGFYLFGGN